MSRGFAWAEKHTLDVGDRVDIRQSRWPLPGLLDQAGTVVEVLRIPCESYLVRVDGDTHPSRVWFFYRVDVVPSVRRLSGRTVTAYKRKTEE